MREDVAGTLVYTYAGREVGRADIVRTGIEIQGFVFDNQKEETQNGSEETGRRLIQINPLLITLIVAAVAILVFLLFVIKHFVDNYYIIRHNMEVRRSRREQFRKVRSRRRHRRRRRW